jgi:serine/threonine protein kinase
MERLIADGPHPFVTTLVETYRLQDRLCFLLELVQGGELFTLLKKRVRLSDSEARFYVANVTLFIEAAHARSVVYRDVKPENLLLDERGYLVAADFGFAKQLSRHSARTFTLCG